MTDKILIVDDEKGILLALRKLLATPRLGVDTAQTIEEAETLIKANSYRAVIADLRLTGVLGTEGLEIVRFVRDHRIDTRLILMTGYGSEEVRRTAMELGVDFYFEKPVRIQELAGALESMGVRR